MKRRTNIALLITLLSTLLLSGCGALSKSRPSLPLDSNWEGPMGELSDVRILLEPDEHTITLDLEDLRILFGDVSLKRTITH